MRGVWRYFRMSELAGINSKEMHVATENTTLFLKQKPTAISERWQLNKADVNSLCEWSRKEREERETERCCPNDLAIRIPRKTLPASIVLLFSTCISYLLSVKINQNDKWLREEGGRVLWIVLECWVSARVWFNHQHKAGTHKPKLQLSGEESSVSAWKGPIPTDTCLL